MHSRTKNGVRIFAVLALAYVQVCSSSILVSLNRGAALIEAKKSVLNNANSLRSRALSRIRNAVDVTRGWEIFANGDLNRSAYEVALKTGSRPEYKLTWWGNMVAGALSRSIAQVALHPFNVVKTLLQTKGSFKAIFPLGYTELTRGAGAQFVLSLPMGALNFAVLEFTKQSMLTFFPSSFIGAGALFDFISSAVAISLASVMSTPTMVLTSRIMTGTYPNLIAGINSITKESGFKGFYAGWFPGLVQKIPSYGLTWVFFQQAKNVHYAYTKEQPSNVANFWLGCIAAAGSVVVMIPMDTVKTRLVTQMSTSSYHYKGIIDCFKTILRDEGVGAFYNSLTPRLLSVVPMIGLQYGILCFLQRTMAEGSMIGKKRNMGESSNQEFEMRMASVQ